MSFLICEEPQIGRLDGGLLLDEEKKNKQLPQRLVDCVGEISVLPRPVITVSPPRVISFWNEEVEEEALLPP